MMSGLSRKKQIEVDTPRVQRVREITDRLIAQAVRFRPDSANWKWEVQVINDPKTVNAFCMAGGKMAIYSGMWEKLKATDEEIAQVMGHEIGHALASHTAERMSIAYSTSIGTAIAAIALGAQDSTAALM
jgi:Zn-dependent protease with chaperone function